MNALNKLQPFRLGWLRDGRRVVVDADLARFILENHNYKAQRNIKPYQVRRLAVQMKNGEFTPGSQMTFAVLPDGSAHLVNGQHRLKAIIEVDTQVEFQIRINEAADEAELSRLYYREDYTSAPRTANDVAKALDLAGTYKVSKTVASAAFMCGVIIADGLRAAGGRYEDETLNTADGRKAAIEPYWPQVRRYDEIVNKADAQLRRKLIVASVMAVALVTLKHQPEKAIPFWTGVAENNGLRKGDPRRSLVVALLSRNFRRSIEIMATISTAWGHWFAESKMDVLVIRNPPTCAPEGTPFEKRTKRIKRRNDLVLDSLSVS